MLYRAQIRIVSAAKFRSGLPDTGNNFSGQGTAIPHGLATDQVICLNGCRTFVNRQDARIAIILRCAGFLDKACHHAPVRRLT